MIARPSSIYSPLRRRERVLIIGCGDVGQRVLRLLEPLGLVGGQKRRVLVLTSQIEKKSFFRNLGAIPLLGNLDDASSLRRLAGIAQRVLHLAPPHAPLLISSGEHADVQDHRTRNILHALRLKNLPRSLVYGSSSGVYGDCAGALVPETRPIHPQTLRAQRRAAAEALLRTLKYAQTPCAVSILRIPGIYAPDRKNASPALRLLQARPVLHDKEDVYSNHIHADDLARACLRALWLGRKHRVYNAADDTQLKIGQFYDCVADALALSRPSRISREQAKQLLTPMQLSFWQESRRLNNARIKCELRLKWRYPSLHTGLFSCENARNDGK